MITMVYGWTAEQWAYAKQRHKLHGNSDVAADLCGMAEVQGWWISNGWPEPMSVRLEGVVLESDHGWAAKAIAAAMMALIPNVSCSNQGEIMSDNHTAMDDMAEFAIRRAFIPQGCDQQGRQEPTISVECCAVEDDQNQSADMEVLTVYLRLFAVVAVSLFSLYVLLRWTA